MIKYSVRSSAFNSLRHQNFLCVERLKRSEVSLKVMTTKLDTIEQKTKRHVCLSCLRAAVILPILFLEATLIVKSLNRERKRILLIDLSLSFLSDRLKRLWAHRLIWISFHLNLSHHDERNKFYGNSWDALGCGISCSKSSLEIRDLSTLFRLFLYHPE